MNKNTMISAFHKSLSLLLLVSVGAQAQGKGKNPQPRDPHTTVSTDGVKSETSTPPQVTDVPRKPDQPLVTNPGEPEHPVVNNPKPVTNDNTPADSSTGRQKNQTQVPRTNGPTNTNTVGTLPGQKNQTQTPQTPGPTNTGNVGVLPGSKATSESASGPVHTEVTAPVSPPKEGVAPAASTGFEFKTPKLNLPKNNPFLKAPETPVVGSQTGKSDTPAPAATGAGYTASNPVKPNSCESDALKKIYDILLEDKDNNALGIMFELSAMRIARRALHEHPGITNLETLAQRDISTLEKQLAKADPDGKVEDDVKKAYDHFGKPQDVTEINSAIKSDLEGAKERAATGCYYDKLGVHRFRNRDTSAFILAVVAGEGPSSGLSDIDAGTIWAVERVRAEAERMNREKNPNDPHPDYEIGTSNGNLLNVSTRVARYLGRILIARDLNESQLNDAIAEQEGKLKTAIDGAYKNFKDELQVCIAKDAASKDCVECEVKARMKVFNDTNMDIGRIQRGLLETIAKADDIKIQGDLKAKIKNTEYDFSNFAVQQKDDKPIPGRSSRDKTDACKKQWAETHKSHGKPSKSLAAHQDSNDEGEAGNSGTPATPPAVAPVPSTPTRQPSGASPTQPTSRKYESSTPVGAPPTPVGNPNLKKPSAAIPLAAPPAASATKIVAPKAPAPILNPETHHFTAEESVKKVEYFSYYMVQENDRNVKLGDKCVGKFHSLSKNGGVFTLTDAEGTKTTVTTDVSKDNDEQIAAAQDTVRSFYSKCTGNKQ